MPSPQRPGQTGFLWFMMFIRSLAVPLEVISHRGFGARYFDLRTGAAAILIWLIPLFFPSSDQRPVWCFLTLYVTMVVRGRLESRRLQRSGYTTHSQYSGFPIICRWRPGWNELAVKRFVEPGLAVLMGCGISRWFNQPLGVVLVCSGLSAFFDVNNSLWIQRERDLNVQDAVIDAESMRNLRRQQ